MQMNRHFLYLVQFFFEWNMFQTKIVEKIKTHIYVTYRFFLKPFRLWDNVKKCGTAGQATDDNMVHALCMLDN